MAELLCHRLSAVPGKLHRIPWVFVPANKLSWTAQRHFRSSRACGRGRRTRLPVEWVAAEEAELTQTLSLLDATHATLLQVPGPECALSGHLVH